MYDSASANAKEAGAINVASSIVGGVGSVAGKWLQGQTMGLWGGTAGSSANPGLILLLNGALDGNGTGTLHWRSDSHPEQSGTPYEHIDTPLAAFGGATAEATQRLGGAIDKTGNELYARAIAMQQLNQKSEAAEAVAKFTTAMGEKYANYRSLEGNAAVKGYQPYIDDLNSTRESIGNGLTSEYARKTYLQESRSIQARSVFSAAAHMGDQNKKFIVGAQTAKIQSFIDGSANSPADENSYRAAIKEIDGSRSMIQTVGGLSDVETDQKIKDMKSALVFKRATALGLEQPRAAQKFLDQAMKGGIINSEQAGRAARFLRTQNLNVSTRIETAKLMSGDSDAWGQGTLSRTRALSALRGVESSDNYNQIHPDVTHKVNGETVTEHGLGAYGIMQSNLQPWLKEAGMKPMTEQEFLANPKAQDDLAWFKFNQYQTQNGTANEAFKRWRGLGGKDLPPAKPKPNICKRSAGSWRRMLLWKRLIT